MLQCGADTKEGGGRDQVLYRRPERLVVDTIVVETIPEVAAAEEEATGTEGTEGR